MSSSQGQAQPGQAQHGAGGCAGPTACGLVWGRWCLARTGREPRERRALHQAASATATAKAAPGRRAPPRGRGAAIARLHDLCVADCLPLQRETVARQHQPLSPALGATIVVLVKVGAGLHDLNEVDVNMLRAIRGCLSGGRYRAGGRAWAEAAHRCHQKSQRAPCQKSSKLEAPPLGDNSPVCAADSWLLVPVRIALSSLFSSRFRLAQFYRHTPLAGSRRRCMGFSLIQSSLQAELLLRYVTFRYVTFRYVTLRSPSALITSFPCAPGVTSVGPGSSPGRTDPTPTHGAPRRASWAAKG